MIGATNILFRQKRHLTDVVIDVRTTLFFQLTLCMLGNFSCFCCRLLTFFEIIFYKIFFQEHYSPVKQFGSISVSPGLDPNWK